jgi:hypothetical protein
MVLQPAACPFVELIQHVDFESPFATSPANLFEAVVLIQKWKGHFQDFQDSDYDYDYYSKMQAACHDVRYHFEVNLDIDQWEQANDVLQGQEQV